MVFKRGKHAKDHAQYSLTWCIDSNSVQNGEKSHFIKKLLEE